MCGRQPRSGPRPRRWSRPSGWSRSGAGRSGLRPRSSLAQVSGREERRIVNRRERLRDARERRQVRVPDDRNDRAVDQVPVRVEMDRDHRLEFQDVLRALVRPHLEVGVVLQRQDGEIADRILRTSLAISNSLALLTVSWSTRAPVGWSGSAAGCWACTVESPAMAAADKNATASAAFLNWAIPSPPLCGPNLSRGVFDIR